MLRSSSSSPRTPAQQTMLHFRYSTKMCCMCSAMFSSFNAAGCTDSVCYRTCAVTVGTVSADCTPCAGAVASIPMQFDMGCYIANTNTLKSCDAAKWWQARYACALLLIFTALCTSLYKADHITMPRLRQTALSQIMSQVCLLACQYSSAVLRHILAALTCVLRHAGKMLGVNASRDCTTGEL